MNTRELQKVLRDFAAERDWDQFHSPKNLVMALSAEAGELTELFQWLTEEQSMRLCDDTKKKQRASEEIADVAIYLLRLCDRLGIDLEVAIKTKITENAAKYPPHLAKGNARKYNEFKS